MKTGFANQIRQALLKLSPEGDISYEAIALELDMIADCEKQVLYRALRDFIRRGECIKVAEGTVRYVGKADPHPAKKTRCMFRLIRANRNHTLTAADLVANCGVSMRNARDYLKVLTERGITRRIVVPGSRAYRYQMIRDPGPDLVRNDENAQKLRHLRRAKKHALDQLALADHSMKSASVALARARRALAQIEGDKGEPS